jgi:hypothetical protein
MYCRIRVSFDVERFPKAVGMDKYRLRIRIVSSSLIARVDIDEVVGGHKVSSYWRFMT